MPQPYARNAELPLTVVGFRVQFDGLDCLDTSDLIQIVRACGMAGQHIPAHTADTVVRAALTRKYVVVLGAVYTPSLSTPLCNCHSPKPNGREVSILAWSAARMRVSNPMVWSFIMSRTHVLNRNRPLPLDRVPPLLWALDQASGGMQVPHLRAPLIESLRTVGPGAAAVWERDGLQPHQMAVCLAACARVPLPRAELVNMAVALARKGGPCELSPEDARRLRVLLYAACVDVPQFMDWLREPLGTYGCSTGDPLLFEDEGTGLLHKGGGVGGLEDRYGGEEAGRLP